MGEEADWRPTTPYAREGRSTGAAIAQTRGFSLGLCCIGPADANTAGMT